VAHVWWVGCISALLAAMRKACSSCSSLSSVASRAELHVAASAATDAAGRRCGWSASTEHTCPSQLWPPSFSGSSCVESSSLSLPASLAGSPWGLHPPAGAPFPVLAALVFVVAVFGLALAGCSDNPEHLSAKVRFWSYCWSSPCSSRALR
jgi:hypothetical protein